MAAINITPGVNFEVDDFWIANGAVSIGEQFVNRTAIVDNRILTLGSTSQTFSEFRFEAGGLTYRYIGQWTLNTNASLLSSTANAVGSYSQVIVEQGGNLLASLVTDAPLAVNLGSSSGLAVAGLISLQPVVDLLIAADSDQSFANLHLSVTPNLPDLAGIDIIGNPTPISTVPTPGPDLLTGTAGNDLISGLAGNDTINGGLGNDTINGNQGNDLVDGGDGRDFLQGGQGNDTLFGGADNDIVYGDFGDDVVNGGAGDDEVNGNVGNDVVRGGQGNDTLSGGQDNDILYGDIGDDLLSGDFGNDVITGGAGADRFEFRANQGNDLVTDFNGAEGDRLSLFGQTYAATESNGSTTLTLSGGGTIVLEGVTASEFSSAYII